MSRLRVLFVHSLDLGWRTHAAHLRRHADADDGIDATHLVTRTGLLHKVLSRPLPLIGRSMIDGPERQRRAVRARVGRAVAGGSFDAVYCAGQNAAAALLEACAASATPLVVSLDVTGPIYARDLLGQATSGGGDWPGEAAVYAAASLLVPWSRWVADSLVADFGVDAASIHVVPPAVPLPPALPQADGEPRIVFVGNDWRRKGGPRLLGWHQRLWAERCELHVVSAKARRRRGLRRATFHGRLPHAAVGRLLRRGDIFVLPTRHDMSPFVLAEAQAAGMPCVTSRLAGLGELVLDGRSGFLVDPDDDEGFCRRVGQFLDDPSLRDRTSAAARRHAAERLDAAEVYPALLDRIVSLSGAESPHADGAPSLASAVPAIASPTLDRSEVLSDLPSKAWSDAS